MKVDIKRIISIITIAMLILTTIPFNCGKNAAYAMDTVSRLYVNNDVYYDVSEDIDKLESEGWFWDASENTLILKGFDGTYLENYGDINVALDGENHIRMDGTNNMAFYTHGGALTVDSVNGTIDDKLIITGEKNGTAVGISTGLNSTFINGGSVIVDVTGSQMVNGIFSYAVIANNDAVLDIEAVSTAGEAYAVTDILEANGSGNISLRAEGISDTDISPARYPTAVNQLVTKENTTSQITLEAVDSKGGQGAAIRDFKTMELGIGGRVIIPNGTIFDIAEGEYFAPNIKITPDNYVLSLAKGYGSVYALTDPSGNVITKNMIFEGQIEDLPMKFVDGSVWDIPEGEVNSSMKKVDIMGGFGARDCTGITFKISEGAFPAGISMSDTGVISGTYSETAAAGHVIIDAYLDGVKLSGFDPIVINYGKVVAERFYFTLDDKQYDNSLDVSGENWSYDASEKKIILNNYTGYYMRFPSDIDIELVGKNTFVPIDGQRIMFDSEGTMNIYSYGEGELNITGNVTDKALKVFSCDVQLNSGATVNADITGYVNLFATNMRTYMNSALNIYLEGDYVSMRAINNLHAYGNSNIIIKIKSSSDIGKVTGISWLNTYDYSGKMELDVQSAEGNTVTAIGGMEVLSLYNGGEINVKRGNVDFYYSSLSVASNIDILPENIYIAGKPGSNMETFVDGSNKVADGGIVIAGTSEDFFKYRINPDNAMSGMTLGSRFDYDLRYGQMGKGYKAYQYVLAEGSLPEGLELYSTGEIRGTPTELSEAGSVQIDIYKSGIKVDSFELKYANVQRKGYYFKINGEEYSAKNDIVGNGWSYNAELNQLTLDGYEGGQIYTHDDLNLKIKGSNTITATDSGTYCDAIRIQSGKLTIEKDSSDETDILIIKNEGKDTSYISGIVTTGGTVLNGGTLRFEMTGNVTPVGDMSYGKITVNNSACLYIDISSENRTLEAIPGELIANGSGDIKVNVSCVRQDQDLRCGINILTVNKGCTSRINVNYETTGFAVKSIRTLGFAEGGRLEVQNGGVGLYNKSIPADIQVTPSEYVTKSYPLVHGYTTFNTMFDKDGNWINRGITFENTGDAPEINIICDNDFAIRQLERYDKLNSIQLSDAFYDFGGRNLGTITYEIAEGRLPEGIEMSKEGRIEGYGMELTDPGSFKVRILFDGEPLYGDDLYEIRYEGVVPCQYPPDVYLEANKKILEIGEKTYLNRGHMGRDTYNAKVTVTLLDADIADFDGRYVTAKAPGKAVFKGVSEREDVEIAYYNIYVKEVKPKGYYQEGYIKGLDPDSRYSINGDERVTDSEGKILVEDNWKNRRNKIIKLSEWEQCYSDEQVLGIVSEDSIVLSEEEVVYSGKSIEPELDVIVDGETLTEGTDYTVEYSNNINPGTATVAVKGIGAYAGKATKSFVIKPPDLSKPVSVTAELYGYNDVKVKWSAVKGATCYYIYYKKGSWKSYKYYGKSVKTTRNIPNLKDGSKYYFRIYPCVEIDGVIYKDFSYKTSKQIFTLKKLNKPTVKKASKKYVKVSWNNINGESGYQIARSKFKNKNFIIVKNVGKLYKSTKVKPPKKIKYYYKVRVYKTVNGKKIFGPWSKVTEFKLK